MTETCSPLNKSCWFLAGFPLILYPFLLEVSLLSVPKNIIISGVYRETHHQHAAFLDPHLFELHIWTSIGG